MDAYAEKYGSKAVRKNVTIPAWLDTFGERNNIKFSQVLRERARKPLPRPTGCLTAIQPKAPALTLASAGAFVCSPLCGLLDDFDFDDVGVVVEVGDGLVEQGGE